MQKLVIALALIALVYAAPKHHELEQYTFAQYVRDFGKVYEPNSLEYKMRKNIFEAKLEHIKLFNKGNNGYKKGVNAFSDQTAEELKETTHGLVKGQKTASTFRVLEKVTKEQLKDIPQSIDWRQYGVVSPVKDQGRCGSCWAFASTAVVESHAAIATGHLKTLSTQQLVSCMANPYQCGGQGGCAGATAELAFGYLQTFGQTSEWKYSYSSYQGDSGECSFNHVKQTPEVTIQGYVKLQENSYEDLLHAVATIGPISISVDASTFHDYESGVFHGCDAAENVDINHAVVLVGYGTDVDLGDYWLVRNSWGTRWGENGYIRVQRSASPVCKVDKTPLDGSACQGYTEPIKACGQCGILVDSAYPLGVNVIG